MLALEVQEGALVGGELRLPGRVTKNKKPLTLPLTGRLLDVLARRWAARVDTCPHVFHRKGRRVVRFTACPLARGRRRHRAARAPFPRSQALRRAGAAPGRSR
jgi:hypothetical protein